MDRCIMALLRALMLPGVSLLSVRFPRPSLMVPEEG